MDGGELRIVFRPVDVKAGIASMPPRGCDLSAPSAAAGIPFRGIGGSFRRAAEAPAKRPARNRRNNWRYAVTLVYEHLQVRPCDSHELRRAVRPRSACQGPLPEGGRRVHPAVLPAARGPRVRTREWAVRPSCGSGTRDARGGRDPTEKFIGTCRFRLTDFMLEKSGREKPGATLWGARSPNDE